MNPLPPSLGGHEETIAHMRHILTVANRILVTTHRHPDGDAVGSILALFHALSDAGKKVIPHTPDAVPLSLSLLPGIEHIIHDAPPLTEVECVIAVDHTDLARTGLKDALCEGRVPLLVVDHHATSDGLGTEKLVLPSAAATCDILTDLLPALGYPLTSTIATCLFAGILTDTGSFQHANTSPAALHHAALLLAEGANVSGILHATFHRPSLPVLRILGRALERIHVQEEAGVAASVLTYQDLEECGATLDDLSGIVSMLNTIPEADMSLLLTEYEQGKIKGSLRSEPERHVDVSKIAAQFGGGGHRLASGFEIAGQLRHDAQGWHITEKEVEKVYSLKNTV